MIRVNNLIDNAFHRTTLVGDGMTPNGNQSQAGLLDLKDIIAELNMQNMILDNVQTQDIFKGGVIKFGKLPDNWIEYKTLDEANEDITNRYDDDVCKVDKTFYYLDNSEWKTDDIFNLQASECWVDFNVKNIPDRVIGVARKLGNRFVPLQVADRMKVDAFARVGLPTMFCQETEYHKITVGTTEYIIQQFIIYFNSDRAELFRITYYESIEDLDIDDILYYSTKYQNLLEEGLCMKLCERYGLLDKAAKFEESYENCKRLIKRINDSNRPLTYDFGINRGWDYSYSRGVAGDF